MHSLNQEVIALKNYKSRSCQTKIVRQKWAGRNCHIVKTMLMGMVFFVFSTIQVVFGQTEWKDLGPHEDPILMNTNSHGRGVGRAIHIAFHPDWAIGQSNKKMLASSGWGGLFYSSDEGASWVNAGTDELPFSETGKAIWAKKDGQEYWIVTGGDHGNKDGHGERNFLSECNGVYVVPFGGTIPSAGSWVNALTRTQMGIWSLNELETTTMPSRVAAYQGYGNMRIHDIMLCGPNQDILLVATAVGLFRSENWWTASPTWVKVTFQSVLAGVNSDFTDVQNLVLNPSNDDEVIIASSRHTEPEGLINIFSPSTQPEGRQHPEHQYDLFKYDYTSTANTAQKLSFNGSDILNEFGVGNPNSQVMKIELRTSPVPNEILVFSCPNGSPQKLGRINLSGTIPVFTLAYSLSYTTGNSFAHAPSFAVSSFLDNASQPIFFKGDLNIYKYEWNTTSGNFIQSNSGNLDNRDDANFAVFEPGGTLNNYKVWAAMDGGVYRGAYVNGAGSWQSRNSGLGIGAIYDYESSAASPHYGVAGTQDCGSWLMDKSAGSIVWTKNMMGGDGFDCCMSSSGTSASSVKYITKNSPNPVLYSNMTTGATTISIPKNLGHTAFCSINDNLIAGTDNNNDLLKIDVSSGSPVITAINLNIPGSNPATHWRVFQGNFFNFSHSIPCFQFVPGTKKLVVNVIDYMIRTAAVLITEDFETATSLADFKVIEYRSWSYPFVPFNYTSSACTNCDGQGGANMFNIEWQGPMPQSNLYQNLDGRYLPNALVFNTTEPEKDQFWLLFSGTSIGNANYYTEQTPDYLKVFLYGFGKDKVVFFDGNKMIELAKPKPDQNHDYNNPSHERFTMLTLEPGPLHGLYATTHNRKLYYTNDCMAEWVEVGDRTGEKGLTHALAMQMDLYNDPVTPANSRLRIATFGRGLWEGPLVVNYLPEIAIEGVGGTCIQAVFTASVTGMDLGTAADWGWREKGTFGPLDQTLIFIPPFTTTGQTIVYEFVVVMPDGTWLEGISTCGETPPVLVTKEPSVRFSSDCSDGYFKAIAFIPDNHNAVITEGILGGTLSAPPVLLGSDFEHGIATVDDLQNQMQDGTYTLIANAGAGCTVAGQFTVWGTPAQVDAYQYGGQFKYDNFIHTSMEIGKNWEAMTNAHLYFKGSYKYYTDTPGGKVFGTTLTLNPGATLDVHDNTLFTSHGNSCGNMWGGIRMPSSGESQITMVGDVENTPNGSIIEHAFTGIRMGVDKSIVDRVNLDGVTFSNCYIGIELQNSIDQENGDAKDLKVLNSTFISTESEMKKPFDIGHSSNNRFMTQFGIFLNYKSAIVSGQIDGCNFVRNLVSIMSYEGSSSSSTCQFNEIGFAGIMTANGLNIPTRSTNNIFNFPPTSIINWQRVNFTTLGKYFSDATLENMHWNLPHDYRYQLSGLLVKGGLAQATGCTLTVAQRNQTNLKYYGIDLINASGPPDENNNFADDEDIMGNRFEGLDVGILKTGQGKLSVRLNRFTNNLIGVQLENGLPTGGAQIGVPIQLNFRCNEFVDKAFPLQVQRVGLKVAANASLGNVGGPFPNLSGQLSPNANVFPVVDRTLPFSHWQSPEGWFSVLNEVETGGWDYYKYTNEFIGAWYTTSPGLDFPSQRWVKLNDTDPNPPNIPGGQVDAACGNIFEILNPFPFDRPGTNNSVTAFDALKKVDRLTILDPIPNPAENMVLIGFYIPAGENRGYLELTDAKGQAIRKVGVIGKGAGSMNLSVGSLANGIYQYRLVTDGLTTEWKRLSVIH